MAVLEHISHLFDRVAVPAMVKIHAQHVDTHSGGRTLWSRYGEREAVEATGKGVDVKRERERERGSRGKGKRGRRAEREKGGRGKGKRGRRAEREEGGRGKGKGVDVQRERRERKVLARSIEWGGGRGGSTRLAWPALPCPACHCHTYVLRLAL